MKKGIGAIAAIMIMVIASVLGLLAASLIATESDTSLHYLNSRKAFFAAESGIQYAAGRLVSNASYRANVSDLFGSIPGGSFNVVVSKSGTIYTLSSTGISQEAVRVVNQVLNISDGGDPAGFNYALALFGNPNELTIGGSVDIDGDLLYTGSTALNFDGSSDVDGTVYGNNVTVGGSASLNSTSSLPNPTPGMPVLNTTWYEGQILVASGAASGDLTVPNKITHDLAGGTEYYNNLYMSANQAVITGTGTIVVTGDIDISGGIIGPDIKLVAGGIVNIHGSLEVGSNATLYGQSGVSLSGNCEIEGNIITPAANNVTIGGTGTPEVTGLIYGGQVKFNGNSKVDGAVVANSYDGTSLTGSVDLIYNRTALGNLTGLGFLPEVVIVVDDWGEQY